MGRGGRNPQTPPVGLPPGAPRGSPRAPWGLKLGCRGLRRQKPLSRACLLRSTAAGAWVLISAPWCDPRGEVHGESRTGLGRRGARVGTRVGNSQPSKTGSTTEPLSPRCQVQAGGRDGYPLPASHCPHGMVLGEGQVDGFLNDRCHCIT